MAQTQPITDEPLYDRINILSTTSPQDVPFFTVQLGQTDPNGGTTGKTYADTNMQRSAQLSEPESFTVRKIRLMADVNTAEADMIKILNTSWLEFQTNGGSIVAWRSPSLIVPAGTGVGFTNAAATTPQNGFNSPSAVYTFVRPLELFINETFKVVIRFSSVPSLSALVKLRCVLEGDHYLVNVTDANGVSTRRAAGGRGV